MATFNYGLQNENVAKRSPTAANMKIVRTLPGGIEIADGVKYSLGSIEGNIVITKVTAVIVKLFGGTPSALFEDSEGFVYFPGVGLTGQGAVNSQLLAPAYHADKTEYFVTMSGIEAGTLDGELAFIVDYVQLDTTNGMHNGGKL